jgi:hypothetical protein
MTYRLARSLQTLREQVNADHPHRSRKSDGWIGDTRHSARQSDHNPNAARVVCALDITHDPPTFDSYNFAEILRSERDHRINYVISNGRIFSAAKRWVWRPYEGSNKHDKHVHISVHQDPARYDDPSPWSLRSTRVSQPDPEPAPVIPQPWHSDFARRVIAWEARRDSQGRLAVHAPGDGSFEVAGISSNAHPRDAAELRDLVNAGRYAEAEAKAVEFIIKYTDPVGEWVDHPAVELYSRDCYFNRGKRGAAIILQRAVGVPVDGVVGPKTEAAAGSFPPATLLQHLRRAREDYEIATYGRREKYWKGLTNRWNNSLAAAQKLLPGTTEKEVSAMSAQTPVPAIPGSAEPPAIPFYKSGVINLSLGSVAAALTAVVNAWKPGVPWHQQLDVQLPLWLALAGGAGTAYKRIMAKAQPVTLTQKGADDIIKEKAEGAGVAATPRPAVVGQEFRPVQALPPLTQLPLEHLARELPLVIDVLRGIVPAIGVVEALVDRAGEITRRADGDGAANEAGTQSPREPGPSPLGRLASDSDP